MEMKLLRVLPSFNKKVYFLYKAHRLLINAILLQVTSALSYLHSPHEVGIVHRDLKCSNVLVFKFPVAGHQCWSREEQDNPVREKQDQCHVLVKLTDMGICANPLATRAKGAGLRMLIPECISADSTRLTEKVCVSIYYNVDEELISSLLIFFEEPNPSYLKLKLVLCMYVSRFCIRERDPNDQWYKHRWDITKWSLKTGSSLGTSVP